MRDLNLPDTEADVVFVLTNAAVEAVRVEPYWECEIPRDELDAAAARSGLAFAEFCGSGYVDVHIVDRRENPPTRAEVEERRQKLQLAVAGGSGSGA